MPYDQILQVDQRTMKKMPCARENNDRQILRPRPIKYVAKRHDIVFFTMHNQSPFGHLSDRKPSDRGCNQNQLLRVQLLDRAGRDVTAEGKTGKHRSGLAKTAAGKPCNRQKIRQFAGAFVKYAVTLTHPAEIETHRRVAERVHRLGKRLHHLVLQRAAIKRMGVGNDGVARAALTRIGYHDFKASSRALNMNLLVAARPQIRNRSTMTPLIRC